MDAFGSVDPWDVYEPPAEIVPGLWLGCEEAARRRKADPEWVLICVHEDARWHHGGYRMPVGELEWLDGGYRDIKYCSRELIDAVCTVANYHVKRGQKVLIHCAAGVERSPLTVAWYLKRFQHTKTLVEAYRVIQRKRPIVQDRRNWLNSRNRSDSE